MKIKTPLYLFLFVLTLGVGLGIAQNAQAGFCGAGCNPVTDTQTERQGDPGSGATVRVATHADGSFTVTRHDDDGGYGYARYDAATGKTVVKEYPPTRDDNDNGSPLNGGKTPTNPTSPYTPVPAGVSATFNANPTTINEGDSSKLSWLATIGGRNYKNLSVRINQGIGSVSQSGGRNVSPKNTTTYTLTASYQYCDGRVGLLGGRCHNLGFLAGFTTRPWDNKTLTRTATVTVVPPPPPVDPTSSTTPPATTTDYVTPSFIGNECFDGLDNDDDGLTDYPRDPSCTSPLDNTEGPKNTPTITASPLLVRSGDKVTVTWDTDDIKDCTLSNNLAGDASSGGIGTDEPTVTNATTYSISCGDHHNLNASVTVKVLPSIEEN